jgi:hypothetical protein
MPYRGHLNKTLIGLNNKRETVSCCISQYKSWHQMKIIYFLMNFKMVYQSRFKAIIYITKSKFIQNSYVFAIVSGSPSKYIIVWQSNKHNTDLLCSQHFFPLPYRQTVRDETVLQLQHHTHVEMTLAWNIRNFVKFVSTPK